MRLLLLLLAFSADKPQPGEQLFDPAKLPRFHLTLTEQQFAALTPAQPQFQFPGFGAKPKPPQEGTHRNTFGVDFPWSQGDLAWNGQTFKQVGVRYKGNYTFMAAQQSLKKSLKIDLDRHIDDQKLDGLSMLNLNSSVTDPTQAREALSYAFFRQAGVPVPRATFAELSLSVTGKYDNEFVGVYTLVEQVNKPFLKKHFADGSGMLLKPEGLNAGPAYMGNDWKPYQERYKPEKNPTADQKKRLIAFTQLVDQPDDDTFARDIGSFLDIEAFLRFLAANTLLANLDSYLGFGHNYYLYLNPTTNRFVFIPWDLDLSLATWPAGGQPEQLVRLSIHHPHAGKNKLVDRLFAIPQYKERYLAILKDLTDLAFTKKALANTLDQMEKILQEPAKRQAKAVAARKEGTGGGFAFGFGNGQFGQTMPPRKFIRQREESINAQFAGKDKGFEPKPFAMGFPGGGGPPGGGPPRGGPPGAGLPPPRP